MAQEGLQQLANAYEYYRNLIMLPVHNLLSDEDAKTPLRDIKGYCKGIYRFVNEKTALRLVPAN